MLKVALGYSKKCGSDVLRVLTQDYNRGKGGAVRMVCYLIKTNIFFSWI